MDVWLPKRQALDGAGAGTAVLEAVVRSEGATDLARFSQRLRALNSLTTRLVLSDVNTPAYDEVVRGVRRVLGCDACALYMADPYRARLELVGHDGFLPDPGRRVLELEDERTCEVQAFLEEYLVHVEDAAQSPELVALAPELRSFLSYPVQAAEGPVGVFSFGSKRAGGFAADDIDMGGMVVDQMTYMLENFRLVRQLASSRDAVIRGMAITAESRCEDIGGHLNRISAYSRLLGLRLVNRTHDLGRVDDAFVETIARASVLHDVGKVGIPDRVLLKPGKLSDDEFAVMRTHTEIGARILTDLTQGHGTFPMLEMGVAVARSHHERWDGTGYPQGLRGRAIPLAARVVSLSDVYDALTSKRVYKDAWGHAEAVAYLREQAGRQFDPELTAIMLENDQELLAIRASHPE